MKPSKELKKACIFIYEVNDEGNIRLSKAGKIEYLTLDLVYLLSIGNEETSHYIHINNISHLNNLSTQIGDKDKRFSPICSQKVPHKKYNAHICKCYKFARESTCIK